MFELKLRSAEKCTVCTVLSDLSTSDCVCTVSSVDYYLFSSA